MLWRFENLVKWIPYCLEYPVWFYLGVDAEGVTVLGALENFVGIRY